MSAIRVDQYRGFDVYFSTENNAYNARPTARTAARHPEFVPVAARSWAELTPVLDFQYAEKERKASWWESGKSGK